MVDDAVVVKLEGVTASDAYAWGIEAGCFMADVRNGEVCGMYMFNAGNMGMIQMIAAGGGLAIEIYGSENELLRCWVSKKPSGLRLVKG